MSPLTAYTQSWEPHRRQKYLMTDTQQPRPYNQSGYLQNGSSGLPPPGAAPLLPNQGRIIQTGPMRVLCIADVRGMRNGRSMLISAELFRKLEVPQ